MFSKEGGISNIVLVQYSLLLSGFFSSSPTFTEYSTEKNVGQYEICAHQSGAQYIIPPWPVPPEATWAGYCDCMTVFLCDLLFYVMIYDVICLLMSHPSGKAGTGMR